MAAACELVFAWLRHNINLLSESGHFMATDWEKQYICTFTNNQLIRGFDYKLM